MNPDLLPDLLRRLPTPAPDPAARERARHRATLALAQAAAGERVTDPPAPDLRRKSPPQVDGDLRAPLLRRSRLDLGRSASTHGARRSPSTWIFAGGLPPSLRPAALAFAGTIAVVLLLFCVRPQPLARHPVPKVDEATLGAGRALLAQVETLFPGQLDAIVERPGQPPDLALSTGEAGGADQPLLIEFSRGGRTIRVLSYSGRRVCVELAPGQRACFEALVTGEGGVVLAGDGFLWTSRQPGRIADFGVSAHPLSHS